MPDPQSEFQQLACYALVSMVHMKMNDMPSSFTASDKLHALVAAGTEKNLADQRPENLAAWYGVRHFGVNPATSDLFTLIVS